MMRAPQEAPPAATGPAKPAPTTPAPPVNLRAGAPTVTAAPFRGLNDPATLAAIIVGTSLLVLVGGAVGLRKVRL